MFASPPVLMVIKIYAGGDFLRNGLDVFTVIRLEIEAYYHLILYALLDLMSRNELTTRSSESKISERI